MAQILYDDLWLCDDCTIAAVNGDFTGLTYHYDDCADEREAEIVNGLDDLGPGLVPAYDSNTGRGILEFSKCQCDCCQTRLHGSRHEFAIIG